MRRKRWEEMSEREVVELKRNQCMKCVYLSKSSPSSISNATCDYILIVGHSRGCPPTECVQKGILKRGKRKGGESEYGL